MFGVPGPPGRRTREVGVAACPGGAAASAPRPQELPQLAPIQSEKFTIGVYGKRRFLSLK